PLCHAQCLTDRAVPWAPPGIAHVRCTDHECGWHSDRGASRRWNRGRSGGVSVFLSSTDDALLTGLTLLVWRGCRITIYCDNRAMSALPGFKKLKFRDALCGGDLRWQRGSAFLRN